MKSDLMYVSIIVRLDIPFPREMGEMGCARYGNQVNGDAFFGGGVQVWQDWSIIVARIVVRR